MQVAKFVETIPCGHNVEPEEMADVIAFLAGKDGRPVAAELKVRSMKQTRTFIVTGGNTGLGFECASALGADDDNLVVIACRDAAQGRQAAQRLRQSGCAAEVLPLDLAKQASVHERPASVTGRS